MTSSILNDSLQGLLESSNQAIISNLNLALLKAELERIYETREGFFSHEEIQQDLSNFSNILEQIKSTSDFNVKKNIILSKYQPMVQYLVDKYRDFLSHQVINFCDRFTKVRIGFAYVSPILTDFASACKNNNINNIERTINELSKVLEIHIQNLNQDILNLIKKIASDLLLYASSPLNIDSPSKGESETEEIKEIFLRIRQISRSILWQLEHYDHDKKSSDSEFDNLLNETQGIWTKGNGLAYQEQVRTGNDPDNIKQEMTGQEAAQFLKIPYISFIKLLEKGELSYHEVNSCKRIRLEDLIVYKQKRDEQRRQGIKEFTAFLEDEGFYNEDYSIDENLLSDAEFDNLLNKTKGIWTKGDGLTYQQTLRQEW